ncbi:hypothetical protein DV737_g1462, partial [Chaetothyriales sp. CBS 132003]
MAKTLAALDDAKSAIADRVRVSVLSSLRNLNFGHVTKDGDVETLNLNFGHEAKDGDVKTPEVWLMLEQLYERASVKPVMVQNRFYTSTEYEIGAHSFCQDHDGIVSVTEGATPTGDSPLSTLRCQLSAVNSPLPTLRCRLSAATTMSSGLSRKRRAPGAAPVGFQQVQQPNNMYGQNINQLSDDQFLQWSQPAQSTSTNPYQEASAFPAGSDADIKYTVNAQNSSAQLSHRSVSQVVARPRCDGAATTQAWPDAANGVQSQAEGAWADDIQELERKAQIAQRDAQAKRKQIPPFVQKLNSFLENGKNTDLIRWSDDGNSFIVLDEDEFAKTLIPELFKHNNYASFVRQLNMYGFHKKVGLSDNSMRASERKNKSPSEYSNPYFRRGHPDLLQEQFKSIQRELAAIRLQQAQISRMMAALKREHEQLYGQAATFQDQHNRHENSINAILTFLATVYNRSIQGPDGAQSIQTLFANAIPSAANQGTVIDQPGSRTSAPQRRAGAVEELFDSAANTPAVSSPAAATQSQPARTPESDMMSVIRQANAHHASAPSSQQDFSNVLSSLENAEGQTPLSSSERADMLRLMHNSASHGNSNDNNALINATPPAGPANFDRVLASTTADLDQLAKLQASQDRSNLDFGNYHDNDDMFADLPPHSSQSQQKQQPAHGVAVHSDGSNDYGFDGPAVNSNDNNDYGFDGQADGGGRVESLASSEVTTPQSNGDDGQRAARTKTQQRPSSVDVSIRAPCCRRWFDCPQCHAETQSHALLKTAEMTLICKKCRKAFRKDVHDGEFDESDEYCPHCDNHYVIEAKTPQAALQVEGEDVRMDARMLKDERVKDKNEHAKTMWDVGEAVADSGKMGR